MEIKTTITKLNYMTTEQQKKLLQSLADIFLSDGTYETLEKLANNEPTEECVVIWAPLQYMSYQEILMQVDALYGNINDILEERI